ncbi:hypothetical protein BFG57_16975 [Bacillus solimangrovi]|uniref:Transposase IS4-like domain-containing protein n=1 Tax=Bacillus solimangrovi TaxID=1305675 RepID=A0A1E5LDA1_9BACI|nr:hypothetical protein BFG57_16975 [Bacillus solimangrovi]
MSSASLSDRKGANPLLKGIHKTFHLPIRYGLLDAGYDFKAIYQQLHNVNAYLKEYFQLNNVRH